MGARKPRALSEKPACLHPLQLKEMLAYLHSCLERQEGVSRIAHLEDAPEAVLGQVADLEDLEVRRHGAEVELCDDNVIDDDGRLGRLVEGGRQEIAGAGVEGGVGRQRRPVEVEGHVELAPGLATHCRREGWTDKPGAAREGGTGWYFGCDGGGEGSINAMRCDAVRCGRCYRGRSSMSRMGRRKHGGGQLGLLAVGDARTMWRGNRWEGRVCFVGAWRFAAGCEG